MEPVEQRGQNLERGEQITTTFLRWMYLRSVFHRGYVLASSLYFVVVAHLTAAQLVLLGTTMALTLVVCDIPAGVWADAIGRRWPLVVGQLPLGAGMVLTGLVTTFPSLVVTQVLWGLGWAFLNGADTAWLNDELNDSQRIARVLTASARWDRGAFHARDRGQRGQGHQRDLGEPAHKQRRARDGALVSLAGRIYR